MVVKCIDPPCYLYMEKAEYGTKRNELFHHAEKKTTPRLIDAIKPFNIINNFEYVSRLSLLNIFADLCSRRPAI